MKNNILLFALIITIPIISSCNSSNKESLKQVSIDYTNKAGLDSLIKATPHSNDTIFLGFTIGMTKSDYKNHIQKLKNEGKTVSFSDSNKFSTIAGAIELGVGYTFETSISVEKSGKTTIGHGKYFLEPVYNKNGNLMQLNILPVEKWDGVYGLDKPDWLETKVKKNSSELSDENLKRALMANNIIEDYNFIRQKGNLIIYRTSLTLNYIDLKTLLIKLSNKEGEKRIIKEENKKIKF